MSLCSISQAIYGTNLPPSLLLIDDFLHVMIKIKSDHSDDIPLLLNMEPDEAIHDFSAGNIEVFPVFLDKFVDETLGGRDALDVMIVIYA